MSVLLDLLRERFDPGAYALFREVRDATGFAGQRSADAVAMSLWPSRGLEMHGFELKISRSDWFRELADPSKAEAVCGYMDRWWIVTTAGIVKPGELPKTWGLLEADKEGTKLVLKHQAPPLEPKPLDRGFIASLLRAAQKEAGKPEAAIREQLETKAYRARQEADKKTEARMREMYEGKINTLERRIAAFELASGLRVSEGWVRAPIGDAVRAVQDYPLGVATALQALAQQAKQLMENATEGAEALAALDNDVKVKLKTRAEERRHAEERDREEAKQESLRLATGEPVDGGS